jgi:hypothetical protein
VLSPHFIWIESIGKTGFGAVGAVISEGVVGISGVMVGVFVGVLVGVFVGVSVGVLVREGVKEGLAVIVGLSVKEGEIAGRFVLVEMIGVADKNKSLVTGGGNAGSGRAGFRNNNAATTAPTTRNPPIPTAPQTNQRRKPDCACPVFGGIRVLKNTCMLFCVIDIPA